MEKCFYRKTSKVTNTLPACLYFLLGITGTLSSVFLLLYSVVTTADLIAVIILLFLSMPMLFLGTYCYFVTSCSYRINDSGITLSYLFNRVRVSYSWKDISSILLCDIDHSNRNADRYRLVIRICVGTDPYGPNCKRNTFVSMLSGREYWRDGYTMYRHPRKIILLDYSPERIMAIEAVARNKVVLSLTTYAAEMFEAQRTSGLSRFPDT